MAYRGLLIPTVGAREARAKPPSRRELRRTGSGSELGLNWYLSTARYLQFDGVRPKTLNSFCATQLAMSVSQGTLTMSETKVQAEGRRRIRGRDSAFGRLARSSSTDMTIAQTMKLLKERGLNVSMDPSQLPAWYMIDSRTSRHITKWDFTLVLALTVVAVLTPFEVAFLPQSQAIDGLFWMNRLLDLIFAVDIVVVCFRIVAITSHVEGMRWIVTPKELFQRYNRSGWFFIDTFTLIVSAMDIVTPLLSHGDSEVLRKFKVRAPPAAHPTLLQSCKVRGAHVVVPCQRPSQHARHPPHPPRRRRCASCGRHAWRGSPSSFPRHAISRS